MRKDFVLNQKIMGKHGSGLNNYRKTYEIDVMKKDTDTAYIKFYAYMTLVMVILGLLIITP